MAENNNKEIARMVGAGELIVPGAELDVDRMPPILAGQSTKKMVSRVERFYFSIGEILELWLKRRPSEHTQRAYRQDIMALIDYLGLDWPKDSTELLTVSVSDVLEWRDALEAEGKAPKTLNRRISSVSSFYKYLQAVASEMRLPIVVPNPAHAQFVGRSSRDAVDETKDLTKSRARKLIELIKGDDVIALRDRAIISFMLYSGARLGTGCKLRVKDFYFEEDEASTIAICEKGNKRRTIGLNSIAAEAIQVYMKKAELELEGGPLFRPRSGPRSSSLAKRQMTTTGMYLLIQKYLEKLPGSMKAGDDGVLRCMYSPHSLRATTATLLLDAGMDITAVQELLGHRHVTTTQVYDKRRRTTKQSASHDVPI